MKRQLFIILLILPQLIFSQEKAGQLWEKANALYSSEKYQEAISAYEQILATGEESAKVYFNLGNAYYKAGDVNNAILSFERAKLLAPNDKDIDFNLSIANQYVVTSIDKLPQPFFLRWRDSVLNKYTVDGWSEISIGAFILFLVLIGLFIFSKTITIRRVSFWLGIFTLIFSGLTFSFAARQKSKITKRNHA
ncbi:MAG: tetratricopeptide repeat protein, partial [Prolixibacteraceae bacterium]|nr:tetratricopeptide repeat protein [Prolixibacteraceae bacterium]